jgi:hypothetical protein
MISRAAPQPCESCLGEAWLQAEEETGQFPSGPTARPPSRLPMPRVRGLQISRVRASSRCALLRRYDQHGPPACLVGCP